MFSIEHNIRDASIRSIDIILEGTVVFSIPNASDDIINAVIAIIDAYYGENRAKALLAITYFNRISDDYGYVVDVTGMFDISKYYGIGYEVFTSASNFFCFLLGFNNK